MRGQDLLFYLLEQLLTITEKTVYQQAPVKKRKDNLVMA